MKWRNGRQVDLDMNPLSTEGVKAFSRLSRLFYFVNGKVHPAYRRGTPP